jgi:two-component system, LytTR family, sensor kinase
MTAATLRDPVLINTIGHTAGLLLFAVVIVLLIRDRRAHGVRHTKLSPIAAGLALAWNVGSLIALASPDLNSQSIALVVTTSFSVLSFLPAVLLQVALQGQQRWIWSSGYAVSAVAAGLHFGEFFFSKPTLHQLALTLIAGGFALLAVMAFWVRRRRTSTSGEPAEWFSLACLVLFTSSFLHFGYRHVSSPWAAEIGWHHISIPVALILLLRDYRFLLLDTFVRFLMNFGLAALYIATVLIVNHKFQVLRAIHSSTFLTGLALVAICLSLILFAYARNVLQAWIGRAIFQRRNRTECLRRIVRLASKAQSENELLSAAAREVANHLRTEKVALLEESEAAGVPDKPSVLFGSEQMAHLPPEVSWAEAQIPLRFSSGDVRLLLTGPRRGRQRYLSEDLEDMRRIGAVIVEQVERFRAEELKRLATQAELRALQAQINPHFLFNALNTLYGTIDRGSVEARSMVLNLAEIFRYFLQGDRAFMPLSEELRIVEAYLEIERLRLGDRLETEVIVSPMARAVMIPTLSIQPLVENAVKHGIAANSGRGRVCLRAEKTPEGLLVAVEDTGPGFAESKTQTRDGAGMGLENVRRRLTLCYGTAADLDIRSSNAGTVVTFFIPDLLATRGTSSER